MIQADRGDIIHTRDKSSHSWELERHPGAIWDSGKAIIQARESKRIKTAV